MGKRAVIYVRTSSEQQAEKCSPTEQEADCRRFAEQHGLVVVNVYRDTERYRVRGKWVEPSGTRYDRPGLLALLRDAADDQFDVIVAWREDRLYRGMRAMLLVLEAVQQHKLTVLLAMETFDPATAPLKAWLAQVELDHIKERMTMGVKARLKAGKANSGQDRYGYRRVGEKIEIVPEEAQWVRQIFAWYVGGASIKEIRKRLMAAHAPQKTATRPRRITWATGSIHGILQGAKDYATGVKIQRRDGDRFEMAIEPILDMDTYRRFLKVRRKHVKRSSPSVEHYSLLRGLLYCDCGYRWQARGAASHYRSTRGEWVQRTTFKGTYICPNYHEELISPDCPRSVSRITADRAVWRQVSEAIGNPGVLLTQARAIIEELQSSASSGTAERERIERELENIALNRQATITRARKGGISEQQMEHELNQYSLTEAGLKRQLASLHPSMDARLFDDWEAKVRQYLEDLKAGLQELDIDPESEHAWLESFALRRQIVTLLVERVVIDRNRSLKVVFRLRLRELLEAARGEIQRVPRNSNQTADLMI